jgi:hypothetical protein
VPTQLPGTPNGLQDMMKFEQTKRRAKTANKVALEEVLLMFMKCSQKLMIGT